MMFQTTNILFFSLKSIILLLSPISISVVEGYKVSSEQNYIPNNHASLTVGALNTKKNFRQSFCDEYELIHNDIVRTTFENSTAYNTSVTIQNVLSGSHINILLSPDVEYFNYDSQTGIDPTLPGIHADILDYIAEKSKFTWRSSFGFFYYDELTENLTFTEFLDWAVDTYDVVIHPWTPTAERMDLGISFTNPYFDGSLIMVKNTNPKSEQKIFWANWILPFEPNVWYVTIAMIFFSAIVYPIIELFGGEYRVGDEYDKDEESLSVRQWLTGRFYLSLINFTGNYCYEPKSLGGCIFGITFAFWSMLMLSTYTANLASLLVVKKVVTIENINTLKDAIEVYHKKICVPQYVYAHDYVIRNYPQYLESHFVLVPPDEKYKALNDGQCDILIGYAQEFENVKYKKESNPDCKLKREGSVIEQLYDTFATKLDTGDKCTLLVNEVFNYYLKQMEETGLLREMWNSHVQNFADPGHCNVDGGEDGGSEGTSSSDSGDRRFLKSGGGGGGGGGTASNAAGASAALNFEDDDDGALSLSMTDMAGTFLFQFAGSAIAIVIKIISYFENKCHRRRKSIRDRMRRISMTAVATVQQFSYSRRSLFEFKDEDEISNSNFDDSSDDNDDSSAVIFDHSIRLPRPPSFTDEYDENDYTSNFASSIHYNNNNNNNVATKDELSFIHHRLNKLQSSNDELNKQMHTIISLAQNISNNNKQSRY